MASSPAYSRVPAHTLAIGAVILASDLNDACLTFFYPPPNRGLVMILDFQPRGRSGLSEPGWVKGFQVLKVY